MIQEKPKVDPILNTRDYSRLFVMDYAPELDSRIVNILLENYNEIFFYVTEKQAVIREFYEKQFANIQGHGPSSRTDQPTTDRQPQRLKCRHP